MYLISRAFTVPTMEAPCFFKCRVKEPPAYYTTLATVAEALGQNIRGFRHLAIAHDGDWLAWRDNTPQAKAVLGEARSEHVRATLGEAISERGGFVVVPDDWPLFSLLAPVYSFHTRLVIYPGKIMFSGVLLNNSYISTERATIAAFTKSLSSPVNLLEGEI